MRMIEDVMVTLFIGIATLWLGSMEARMRAMVKENSTKMGKEEAKEYINLKFEVVANSLADIKEDGKEIKESIKELSRRQQ